MKLRGYTATSLFGKSGRVCNVLRTVSGNVAPTSHRTHSLQWRNEVLWQSGRVITVASSNRNYAIFVDNQLDA